MEKRRNKRKLGRFPDCLNRKKADNSKRQKKAYCKSRELVCISFKNMWKTVKHAQHWTVRQPCLLNIQRLDESYITKLIKKIEKLKNILLPALYSANLLDFVGFEYQNNLPLPRII